LAFPADNALSLAVGKQALLSHLNLTLDFPSLRPFAVRWQLGDLPDPKTKMVSNANASQNQINIVLGIWCGH
jgi:hypothetical protein